MLITGNELDVNQFCKCGNDYNGDRIILQDATFIPILGGEQQPGLDFSNFFKNVSQANVLRFVMKPYSTRLITDIDGNGVKFLAIYEMGKQTPASKTPNPDGTQSDPDRYKNFPKHKHQSTGLSGYVRPLYWKKNSGNPILQYVTAILNGTIKIASSPFVSDRINANITLTWTSDNNFKLITWTNLDDSFIDGEFTTTWNEADYSWNDYNPLITTNVKLVADPMIHTLTLPVVIEQDLDGNYVCQAELDIQIGTSMVKTQISFKGQYPTTFVIDKLTVTLDGHLVGDLFILPGTLSYDFSTTPLSLTATYDFLASSGLIKEYDKIVGIMVLTTTNNEPIADIELYNGNPGAVDVAVMIGS